jgi:hypothetical protein
MAKREPPKASPKLQSLLKDFQHIASMAGFLTHAMDPPQLRLQFTLYGRVSVATEAEAQSLTAGLQGWSDRLGVDLREGSSAAILPPQVQIGLPQPLPAGGWYVVATLTFTTKVTDASYLRVRTAVLKAYQRAVILREKGLEVALARLADPGADPLEELPEPEPGLDPLSEMSSDG